jgi:HlyD family secretion protein
MKKLLALLALVAVAGWFVYRDQTELPKVPFAKTARERLASTLSTNGRLEPLTYTEVRVPAPGLIQKLMVQQGSTVRAGQALAELAAPDQSEELTAAQARVAQMNAELSALEAGGRGSEIAEIEGAQARLRGQREAAQKNLDALNRLVQASAATKFEADQAAQGIRDIDNQLQSLAQKRFSLVARTDLDAARARIREAQASVDLIAGRISRNILKSPTAGSVYNLPIRAGAFLNAGDILGSVGQLDPVRVRVYVDEPELGRVATGQPVRITWDALPGREWTGKVEQKPTQVIALGSRQVGEVLCTIANPGAELVPGTNVNAFILTQVVENALTIPRTAVRRESGTGVYVLDKTTGTVQWRNIRTGASDALRVEVLSGLADADLVAQPSDVALKPGLKIAPTIQ